MDESLKKLLFDIDVQTEGEFKDNGYYVVKLSSYNEFNKVYNTLEQSLDLERDSEESWITEEKAHVQYYNKQYIVELIALFDEDDYTLNIIKDN